LKTASEKEKPAIESELEKANNTLTKNKGGGIEAELKGSIEEEYKLGKRERDLTASLELERPALLAKTKENIINNTKNDDHGRYLDPSGKPINGRPVFGHVYGKEHRRLALEAIRRGYNQSQFNDWVNDNWKEFFALESEADNLSHQYEKPGID